MSILWECTLRNARQADDRSRTTITAEVSEILAMASEIDRLREVNAGLREVMNDTAQHLDGVALTMRDWLARPKLSTSLEWVANSLRNAAAAEPTASPSS